jgi:hypothetical protein
MMSDRHPQTFNSPEETHISCEIAGDPADPMTAQRRALFEPINMKISDALGKAYAPVAQAPSFQPPPCPANQTEVVESKLIQCQRCDTFVAMLVFAPAAVDTGHLEDYARLMYPEYSRRNLPTWIIGPSSGPDSPADILPVWPQRQPVQRLTPAQFEPLIDRLASRHCQ